MERGYITMTGHQSVLSEREYALLCRFKKDSEIRDDETRSLVRKLAQLDLMKLGCQVDPKKTLVETAVITPLGRRTLAREKILRSRVRRFFHRQFCKLT